MHPCPCLNIHWIYQIQMMILIIILSLLRHTLMRRSVQRYVP